MGLGCLVTIASSSGSVTNYINTLVVDASFDRAEISIDIHRRSIQEYLTKSAEIIIKLSLVVQKSISFKNKKIKQP